MDGIAMGCQIAELYRRYADEDGIHWWWTKWQPGDRVTGREVEGGGERLIEIEHRTVSTKGPPWRRREVTEIHTELYAPDRVRYWSVAEPRPDVLAVAALIGRLRDAAMAEGVCRGMGDLASADVEGRKADALERECLSIYESREINVPR